MADHDPLCPVIATDCAQCPQCALIARVRADERKHIAQYVRGGTEFWDALATEIRRVDGNHTLGAAAMAEKLVPFIAAAIARGAT